MLSCVKPRLLTYMSEVGKMDKIPITEDLSIVGTSKDVQSVDTDEHYPSADPAKKEMFRSLMLEKLDNYLLNHHLEIKLPQAIVESNIVPRSLVDSVPKSLSVPLLDATQGEGESTTVIDFHNISIICASFRSWFCEKGHDTISPRS